MKDGDKLGECFALNRVSLVAVGMEPIVIGIGNDEFAVIPYKPTEWISNEENAVIVSIFRYPRILDSVSVGCPMHFWIRGQQASTEPVFQCVASRFRTETSKKISFDIQKIIMRHLVPR